MTITVPDLLKMSQAQLDDLFTKSPPGEIPDGEANGTAIIAPGTAYTAEIAALINHFAWQGKTFDAKKGVLRNRILPFGLNAIIAKVYKAPSWLDGAGGSDMKDGKPENTLAMPPSLTNTFGDLASSRMLSRQIGRRSSRFPA